MNWLRTIQTRFHALFRKRELDAEMDEEMHSHIEMRTQENIDAGMSPEEARFAALRQFGGTESIKEDCRDQRGVTWLENLVQDIRYGARQLRKNPGFTAVAVLTLALGIGANTAIFSVINGVVLKPLPYEQPGNLVNLWLDAGQPGSRNSVSGGAFLDWQEHCTSFEALSVIAGTDMNRTGTEGHPERVSGLQVSANFLQILRIHPLAGRDFLPSEDKLGHENRLVLLTEALWQRRFGGDTNLMGKIIRLNADSYTIIGILPGKAIAFSPSMQFLVPFVFGTEQWHRERGDQRLSVIARLRPGVTEEQASAEMAAIWKRLRPLYPKHMHDWGTTIVPLHEQIVGRIKPTLMLLAVAVGCVLLIACANVANLLLARATARQKEFALRAALGAGRWRIVRQLVTESTLLAVLGGILGVALASWGVQVLSKLGESLLPRAQEAGVDARVLVFSLLVSLGAGLLFGLVPALHVSTPDLNRTLKEGGRTSLGGARNRVRGALIVSEVALALVLLVGAGLLLRSFVHLLNMPPGFTPQQAIAMDLSLPSAKYPDGGSRARFLHEVFQRVEALPGVDAVGMATTLPLIGWSFGNHITVEGRANQPEFGYSCGYDFIAGNYTRAMGIPLLRGRPFSQRDNDTNAPRVALLSEALVRKVFPNEDAIGKRIRFWGLPWEVVGILGDVRHYGLDNANSERIYLPQAFCPWSGSLVVRTKGEPSALSEPIRQAILGVDPDQPVSNVRSLEQAVARSVADRRLTLSLLGIFASVALGLAGIGLYGVMAYAVSQRTHEIGTRMALGAQQMDVLKLVIRQAMELTFLGMGTGLAAAFALTRVIASQLYEVGATDPVAFVGVSILIIAVALIACCIPARRATKVDPMVALRYE